MIYFKGGHQNLPAMSALQGAIFSPHICLSMIIVMMHKPALPRLFMLALAALFSYAPANAFARDLNLRFEANWGGLHVADFTLSLKNGGDTYENRFHLETRGLTRYLTKMSVTAHSKGRIVAPPPQNGNGSGLAETYLAQSYRTEYTNRRHFRWVNIDFGPAGEPAHASTGTSPVKGREENWNPAEKGPEVLEKVGAEFRIGVNDPISMIPQMMAMVRAHLKGGPASVIAKGFDGRRRFDMDVTYLGLASRTVGKVKHDTYHVRVVPKPVAGFKKRHATLWNNSTYDFYLSRDGRFVPLQIVPVKHGPVLTLMAECESECQIAAEKD